MKLDVRAFQVDSGRAMDKLLVLLFVVSFIGMLLRDLLDPGQLSAVPSNRPRYDLRPNEAGENLPAVIQADSSRWRLEAIAHIGRMKGQGSLTVDDRQMLKQMLLCPFSEVESNAFDLLSKDPNELPFLIGYMRTQEAKLMQFLEERCQSNSKVNLLERFFQTKNLRLLRKVGSQAAIDGPQSFSSVWNVDLTVARRMLEGILSQEFNTDHSDGSRPNLIQPGRRELLPRLGQLIGEVSQEPPVRIAAVQAVAEIDAIQGWETLTQALGSDLPVLRYTAVEALGNSGRLEAIPLLLNALNDTNSFVCSMAMEGLSRLDAQEAVSFLIDAVESSQAIVAFSARQALMRMSCRDEITNRLLEALPSAPNSRKAVWFELLAQMEERRVIPWLEEALSCEDPDVTAAAANGLLHLRETKRLPQILAISNQLGSEAKELAQLLEKELGTTDVGSFLSERISELNDPDIQYFGIQLLLNEVKRRQDPGLPDVLLRVAKAENPFVRGAAIAGLGTCEGTDGLELITKGLSDPDEYVRVCAISALYQRNGTDAFQQFTRMLSTEHSEDVLFALLMCFKRDPNPEIMVLLERQLPQLPEEIAALARQIISTKTAEDLHAAIQAENQAKEQAKAEAEAETETSKELQAQENDKPDLN